MVIFYVMMGFEYVFIIVLVVYICLVLVNWIGMNFIYIVIFLSLVEGFLVLFGKFKLIVKGVFGLILELFN